MGIQVAMIAGRRKFYRQRLAATVMLVMALAAPAGAQDQDGTAAKPEANPQMLIAKPKNDPLLPRPRPDPHDLQGASADRTETEATASGRAESAAASSAGDREACRWRLRALGVAFEPGPPAADDAPCVVAAPLVISELSPGIAVSPEAVLTCEAAEAVATWMRDVVGPAADRHLQDAAAGIEISSSFACRASGFDAIARAHASASAVDVTGVAFRQGQRHLIRNRDSESGPEAAFQRAIRIGACRHFARVQGPGSNFGGTELGDTHLHLDVAERSGGERICR